MFYVLPSAEKPPAFPVVAGEQDPAGAGAGCDQGEVFEWYEEGVGVGRIEGRRQPDRRAGPNIQAVENIIF